MLQPGITWHCIAQHSTAHHSNAWYDITEQSQYIIPLLAMALHLIPLYAMGGHTLPDTAPHHI
eukprot:5630630-Pyramimonas_sp.AAC.1